ncbi:flavodoxin family protein [Xylella fastidiosa]|uniref:Tryptophan repressor binding protein n=1 Tax=Xylella fastidiosa (strain 9a5c) TaxID=160492 RepID=Q9PCP5_XYLFA|nr:flavodoxin family protein [Xylella fastidiosa]AAF84542.1 tryptophan repressor binding protein [Xylella fastidiosa 9a5c]ALQ95012.1 NADPH-dependent FMN reductase [Xylella fastidiosa]ALQ97073.1 flavodoxin family protein [Xylella fastidiosa]ALR02215.1 NADPH-dependent FMN reductase [Xylella fastidiosa]ALR04214.1 flavodoxin family protein [Xylella fastidiosa]
MLISIVYDSGYGHTERQARAVAEGVAKVPGAQAKLITVGQGEMDWSALEASDAIVFGSPTYNGSLSAKLKQFFEDSTKAAWSEQKWRNKIAAGFTNSGAQHGDKLNTLIGMALFAAQHGMIWVGLDLMPGNSSSTGSVEDLNRHGAWLGAMAQSNMDEGPDVSPPASDLKTAAYLGQRVAETTQRFARGASA